MILSLSIGGPAGRNDGVLVRVAGGLVSEFLLGVVVMFWMVFDGSVLPSPRIRTLLAPLQELQLPARTKDVQPRLWVMAANLFSDVAPGAQPLQISCDL
jgi:hypothetical protein